MGRKGRQSGDHLIICMILWKQTIQHGCPAMEAILKLG